MSALDPVILQGVTKVAAAVEALAGSSAQWPVGAIVELPDTQPEVSVYGQTFLRSGVVKDVGAGSSYPEDLAAVCPNGGAVSASFQSAAFNALSVACSDDTVVFTRNSSAQTNQLYVARRSTGFAFEEVTLPGAAATPYSVAFVGGIWFFLPNSGGTVVYSIDDLATFATVASAVSSPRRVRLFEQTTGDKNICFIPRGSSSTSYVSVHAFAPDGTLNSGSSLSTNTTYVADIVYVPDIQMYFFIRAGGSLQKSATLAGVKSNITTVPTTVGGTNASTPSLVDSGTPMSFAQLFEGKILYPLSGAGLVQMDPGTSEVSLVVSDASTSSYARTLMPSDGRSLLMNRTQSTAGSPSGVTRLLSAATAALNTTLSLETSSHFAASRKLFAAVSGGGGVIYTAYSVFAGAKKYIEYKYVRIA